MAAILNKSSAVAEMGDRLATIDMGEKWGGAAVGGLGPHLTWPEPRPFGVRVVTAPLRYLYQVAS